MKKDNITKIYNLDKYNISNRNGAYGGQAGSKEGIIIDNEYWLVKYPKTTKSMSRVGDLSYTTSPLSEYIGSHIYEILGIDVHKTILGIRNNKLVVACKDFCKKDGALREIRVIKNIYNKELEETLETELHSTSNARTVQLDEILIHINNNPILVNIKGLKERFCECIIVDGLINNNDRNNGNWGLLYEDNNYFLAPVYDNGASFLAKSGDDKINDILNDKDRLHQSSMNTISVYGNNEKHYSFKEIMNLNILPEMKDVILELVPLIKEKMIDIKEFINNISESYNEYYVCSKIRKEFYIKSIEIRLNEILIPLYNKLINNEDTTI